MGENYPKVNVSAHEAEEFCKVLSERVGRDFRLPTEVEQCRALGLEPKSSQLASQAVWGKQSLQPVKTLPPNEFGLYDVRGLVWEWTGGEDEDASRCLRGGSWFFVRGLARAVFRYNYPPAGRFDDVGFRVVSPVI